MCYNVTCYRIFGVQRCIFDTIPGYMSSRALQTNAGILKPNILIVLSGSSSHTCRYYNHSLVLFSSIIFWSLLLQLYGYVDITDVNDRYPTRPFLEVMNSCNVVSSTVVNQRALQYNNYLLYYIIIVTFYV